MANEKFTKGRWVVSESPLDIGHVTCNGHIVAVAYSGESVPCIEKRYANAYLIAALPEMYAFINKMALALSDDYPALRDSALELLAKARGEL